MGSAKGRDSEANVSVKLFSFVDSSIVSYCCGSLHFYIRCLLFFLHAGFDNRIRLASIDPRVSLNVELSFSIEMINISK